MPPIAPARSARRALQAVLFDMDGLLIDSEPLWFEVESEVMAHLGGQWDAADQQALVGGSLDRTVDYLLARATRAVPRDEIGRWLVDGLTALLRERGVPVLPGARELLAEVTDAGMPSALVTSSERQIMEAVIPKIGMNFGATVCAEDVREPSRLPSRTCARRSYSASSRPAALRWRTRLMEWPPRRRPAAWSSRCRASSRFPPVRAGSSPPRSARSTSPCCAG